MLGLLFERLKITVIHRQFGLPPTWTTLHRLFRHCSLRRNCVNLCQQNIGTWIIHLDNSVTYIRPNSRSNGVKLDGPNERYQTIRMEACPFDRLYYVNMDNLLVAV